MKSKVITIILILVNFGLCYGQDEVKLSNFLYSIPVMEGMEIQGRPEEVKYNISDDIEIAIITKVFHSEEGKKFSAEQISKFYTDYFVSKGFRAREDTSDLYNMYNAPRVETSSDNAGVVSQGRIRCWIPKEGNSVTFFIYQRRSYHIRQSQNLLNNIKAAFEKAASEFQYKFTEFPDYTKVSDWPEYLENECFVDRIFVNVIHKEIEATNTGTRDRGVNNSFRFYCSVFPTFEHAKQWRDKLIEEHGKIKRWPDWFVEGAAMPPVVVGNIVVEYKGRGGDKNDSAFGKMLIKELNEVETTN